MPSIISGINELRDDTIRFRIVDSRNDNNFIPLSYAITAINGTKEIFLAAASSVLKPQARHPRLSRVEAWQLLDASRFQHTETGSFVIKISSPINALEVQGNLFEENIPFARQTTLVINNHTEGFPKPFSYRHYFRKTNVFGYRYLTSCNVLFSFKCKNLFLEFSDMLMRFFKLLILFDEIKC